MTESRGNIFFDNAAGSQLPARVIDAVKDHLVHRMVVWGLRDVELVAVDTDPDRLAFSPIRRRIRIGRSHVPGPHPMSAPEVSHRAVEESRNRVAEALAGSDMVFIVAGMGDSTGTGAAPLIAKIALEAGALTVGLVTEPLDTEGPVRIQSAEAGIEGMKKWVNTLIRVPLQRLNAFRFQEVGLRRPGFLIRGTPNPILKEILGLAEDLVVRVTQGICDSILLPGLICIDFNDVKLPFLSGKEALVGTGGAEGTDRGVLAARRALASPLMKRGIWGAGGVLVHISAGDGLNLFEVNDAVSVIRDAVGSEDDVLWSAPDGEDSGDELRVTVIATGFTNTGEAAEAEPPVDRTEEAFDTGPLSPDSLEYPTFLRKRRGLYHSRRTEEVGLEPG